LDNSNFAQSHDNTTTPLPSSSSGGGIDELAIHQSDLVREAICEETLAMGCVQSFVDFFYLTHRPDPLAGEWEGRVVVVGVVVVVVFIVGLVVVVGWKTVEGNR